MLSYFVQAYTLLHSNDAGFCVCFVGCHWVGVQTPPHPTPVPRAPLNLISSSIPSQGLDGARAVDPPGAKPDHRRPGVGAERPPDPAGAQGPLQDRVGNQAEVHPEPGASRVPLLASCFFFLQRWDSKNGSSGGARGGVYPKRSLYI